MLFCAQEAQKMDQTIETTKIVHIGKTAFKIPAHMTVSGMAEC